MKRSSLVAIVVVVVIIVVIAGAITAVYYKPKKTTPNTLTVEESQYPDSFDPAVTFTTPGWEIVDQVYQGLVAPNGTSETSFVPVLATNWTVSSDAMSYTFYLRHNVTFSNGDPFNAYSMWFSLYRTMVMNQAPAFILEQNMATNITVGSNAFNINASILNQIGKNYSNPSSADLAIMEASNQSVQVVNPYEIILNLGAGYNGPYPYNVFLMTLTTPVAMAVDPSVVVQNGGVVDGATNSYLANNTMGTGFYKLNSVTTGQSISLVENPNYWGNNLSSSQLNDAISPPHIKYIVLDYKQSSAIISDLRGGKAQIVEAPSTDYSTLKNISGITVNKLPIQFGSSENAYYVYMDTLYNTPSGVYPFQNIDVRKAVTFAIDYTGLINSVYDGLAVQWIGPTPPGFQYYNQTVSPLSPEEYQYMQSQGFSSSVRSLTPYAYNATAAAIDLHAAGYRAILPNGTILSGTPFPTLNFLYESDSSSQTNAALIIQQNLAAIGINVTLKGLTLGPYTSVIYGYGTNSTLYPMGINFYTEDYSASIDYVYNLADGYYNGSSDYYNNTVFNWTINASISFNSTVVAQNLTYITYAMYVNYTMPWLYVPYLLSINSNNVAGMIPNTAGSGAGYFMFYNTVHYVSTASTATGGYSVNSITGFIRSLELRGETSSLILNYNLVTSFL